MKRTFPAFSSLIITSTVYKNSGGILYDGFNFVEIFNTGCVMTEIPNDKRAIYDMLSVGKKLCTATNNNHNRGGLMTNNQTRSAYT